ncbi:MAG: hypothetical protein DBY32_01125 [Phascolarctobacterium sp.]|nr:MAG: hypothetical protein DBY32_01125 [Phascolarctobacterium sp.]
MNKIELYTLFKKVDLLQPITQKELYAAGATLDNITALCESDFLTPVNLNYDNVELEYRQGAITDSPDNIYEFTDAAADFVFDFEKDFKPIELAKEANRISQKANELSAEANKTAKEANRLSEAANKTAETSKWIAILSALIALVSLLCSVIPGWINLSFILF